MICYYSKEYILEPGEEFSLLTKFNILASETVFCLQNCKTEEQLKHYSDFLKCLLIHVLISTYCTKASSLTKAFTFQVSVKFSEVLIYYS